MQSSEVARQQPDPPGAAGTSLPLCVDLDGTLIHTDLMAETVMSMLASKPWLALQLPLWLASGWAVLKRNICRNSVCDPAILPYDERVLAYVKAQKAQGRMIVLATASVRPLALAVAGHLGCFDEVVATDGDANLSGARKAAALVQRFGRFAYIGNHRKDLPVWALAAAVGIANAPPALVADVQRRLPMEVVFPRRRGRAGQFLRALRPHQWSRNLLIFVPILTEIHPGHAADWRGGGLAFVAFNLAASGMNVLDDMIDLAADRAHPRKCHRPFASGRLPVAAGFVLAPALLAAGLLLGGLAAILPVLLLYALTSTAYALRLKLLTLVDVFVLAFLCVLRLYAGGQATGNALSFWLVGFFAFLFLALALAERVAELVTGGRDSARRRRRGYDTDDIPLLTMMGLGAGFSASLLLALYVQRPEVAARFHSPGALWVLVPLLLFWQMRLWLSTSRGQMHDDPIVCSARDWVAWLVSAAAVGTILLANPRSCGL
jgi:4-hydroxybenzoate polyprenyltransferase/phosphoserine phosphatase